MATKTLEGLKQISTLTQNRFAHYVQRLADVFRWPLFTDQELKSLVNTIRERDAIQAVENGKVENAKDFLDTEIKGEIFTERANAYKEMYYDLGRLKRTFLMKAKLAADEELGKDARDLAELIKQSTQYIDDQRIVGDFLYGEGEKQVKYPEILIKVYMEIANQIHKFLANYYEK